MTLTADWVEVTPSQFAHEAEGLRLLRDLLPNEAPFRAWSNFEFRDGHGKWHEIDLVVLGRRRMHLVELKYYSGTLRGDDHVWRRDGHPAEDSPLKLARRKAQRLASKLTDELRSLARESKQALPDTRTIVPFVQEAVFLHHENLTCLLPMASRPDLFGPEGRSSQTLLPGIGERLLEPAAADQRGSIGVNRSAIIATLMQRIGAVQRRQREAGSWIVDEEPLDEGENWQDWPAFHRVTRERKARIRFFVSAPGRSEIERGLTQQVAEHEFRTVSTLKHDGVIAPIDLVDTELGTGLVYPRHEQFQRLDLWMADHPDGLPLLSQLSLLRQVGEALAYAHRHRVVHRGLNPSVVLVRQVGNAAMQALVANWQMAGAARSGTAAAATGTGQRSAAGNPSPVTLLGTAARTAVQNLLLETSSDSGVSPDAFRAPEGVWSADADRVRLDVFALGALAYFLVARRPPATSTTTLRERLARDQGLDLAADLAQVPSRLRALVLEATRPTVSERTADVASFLQGLAEAERVVAEPDQDDDADPIEALPGTLIAGRFRLEQRLGSGSTAVGLLVTDLAPGSDKGDPRRVLKVAVDDRAAERLADEAAVLRSLRSPRIVRLVEGPLAVGSRIALVLQFAGAQTLADVLSRRTRLSLDLLERYGSDLLTALGALDAAGVDHRDIKPANLGVVEGRSTKAKHLVLFDLSLARAAASAIDAGTRGYLDPFLGSAGRHRYDSAAERYAASVVLFEMATGMLPVYGDGGSDPVASGGALRIEESIFDPAVAAPLLDFFTRALAPTVAARHHTAQEMAVGWQAIFAPVSRTEPEDADELAAAATESTALTNSGLSARALSAIEPLGVGTVGDLVALDPVRLNRLPGAADATRKEVKSRAKMWRARLGPQVLGRTGRAGAGTGGTDLPDPIAAAELLAAPFGTGSLESASTTLRGRAVRQILGLDPGLDAFVPQSGLGAELGVSKPRGPQLIDEMQSRWGDDDSCRDLLTSLQAAVFTALAQLGGVATVNELAESVRSVLPGPVEVTEQRRRVSAGLLRVTLDRAAALNRAQALDLSVERRRDRDGRLATVASRLDLLTAAEAAGRRADELVQAASARGEPLIAQARAAAALRIAFESGLDPAAAADSAYQVGDNHNGADQGEVSDPRLVRLGAALSQHAAVAGDGSLHHRDLELADALRITMVGLATGVQIAAQELRDRVRARFPALPAVPDRSHGLDTLIERAGLALVYDEADRVYRSRRYRPPTTGLATRVAAVQSTAAPAGPDGHVARRLQDSRAARSFLALGVSAPHLRRSIDLLRERCSVTVLDVTAVLIETMQREADSLGMPWATVTAADAAEQGTRAAAGLAALVARAVPAVHEAIRAAGADRARPVLVTETAPLARYGHLEGLARWTDLTAARPSAVWLLVPQLHGSTGALIDGTPLPLAAPGQLVQLDDAWLASAVLGPAPPTASTGSRRNELITGSTTA